MGSTDDEMNNDENNQDDIAVPEDDGLLIPFRRFEEDFPNILYGDVNNLISILTGLTQNYRLLVGAAEEFNRTAAATPILPIEATARASAAGELIDQVLKVLAIKLDYVLDVLDDTKLPLPLILAGVDQARAIARQRQRQRQELERRRREFESFLKEDFRLPEFIQDLEFEVDEDLDTEVEDELEFGDDPRPE